MKEDLFSAERFEAEELKESGSTTDLEAREDRMPFQIQIVDILNFSGDAIVSSKDTFISRIPVCSGIWIGISRERNIENRGGNHGITCRSLRIRFLSRKRPQSLKPHYRRSHWSFDRSKGFIAEKKRAICPSRDMGRMLRLRPHQKMRRLFPPLTS